MMFRVVLGQLGRLPGMGPVARRLLGAEQQNGMELYALVMAAMGCVALVNAAWMLALGGAGHALKNFFSAMTAWSVARFLWTAWDDDGGGRDDGVEPEPPGGLTLTRTPRGPETAEEAVGRYLRDLMKQQEGK